MQQHVAWTPALDDRLVGLRATGVPWDVIARELDMGRFRVRERGRRLGAQRLPVSRKIDLPEARDRPPLTAGHPKSWGLITAGTLLDGEAYPLPVFL